MRSIHVFVAALQLTFLGGKDPSLVQSFETRTPLCHFRTSFLGSKNVRSTFRSVTSPRRMNSKPEEYDDGIGDITNPKTGKDDEDLVAEFYKSLQERKDTLGAGDSSDASLPNKATSEASFEIGKSPSAIGGTGSFFDANDDYEAEENKPARKIKFTGRQMDSSDYFGASTTNDSGNRVRENMMRREYDLVSGATSRSAITFQAGLALFMLIFFIYIGLSGGIVSGDAALVDYGGEDLIQFEEIIPIPRDSDQSVWI